MTIALEVPRELQTRQPLIELEGVEKVYRTGKLEYPALARGRPDHRGGRDGGDRRPVGQRQDDDHEHDHRHRPADRRHRHGRRAAPRTTMSEEELAIWRGSNVGIVFQFFQLLPTLSALENAMLPLDFARRGSKRERFETRAAQPRARRTRRQARPPAGRALRRRAAARRDRTCARRRPEADHRRRADGQPRHADRSGDVRAAAAPERRGQDRALRHSRPRVGCARRPR